MEYDRQELGRLIGNREFDGGLMLISEGYMFALPAHAETSILSGWTITCISRLSAAREKEWRRGSDLSVTGGGR